MECGCGRRRRGRRRVYGNAIATATLAGCGTRVRVSDYLWLRRDEAAKINMANIEKTNERTTETMALADATGSNAGGEEGEGSHSATRGKRGVDGGHRKIHNVTPNREE